MPTWLETNNTILLHREQGDNDADHNTWSWEGSVGNTSLKTWVVGRCMREQAKKDWLERSESVRGDLLPNSTSLLLL